MSTPESYADCLIKLGETIKDNEAYASIILTHREEIGELKKSLSRVSHDYDNVKRQHENALRDDKQLRASLEQLREKYTNLEVANTDLKNRCGRLRRDANRAKDISASTSTMTIGEIAAFRSISAVRMNRFLKDHGLISKTGSTWIPSAKAMGLGLAKMTAVTYRRTDRSKKATKNFLRWTEKGREYILHLYDTERVPETKTA